MEFMGVVNIPTTLRSIGHTETPKLKVVDFTEKLVYVIGQRGTLS